jgi:histidine triad (HIT) family protein
MNKDCIFCAIVAGKAPAEILDQDDHTVAFLDINPWSRGHSLVVPRRHAKNLYEIDQADLEHSFIAAKRLATRLRESLPCQDMTLLNSSESAAWQVVQHFHVHLIPRYADDDLRFPRPERVDAGELAQVAAELRG